MVLKSIVYAVCVVVMAAAVFVCIDAYSSSFEEATCTNRTAVRTMVKERGKVKGRKGSGYDLHVEATCMHRIAIKGYIALHAVFNAQWNTELTT